MKIILNDARELTITSAIEEYNPLYLDQPETYADILINDDTITDIDDIVAIFTPYNISNITVVNDLNQTKTLSNYSKVRTLRRNYSTSSFETLIRLIK